MSDPRIPDLPPGYELIADLRRRPGLRVARARRGAEEVALRIETGPGGESQAELAVLAALDARGLARLVDHGRLPGGGRFVARRWIAGLDLAAWSAGRSAEEIGRAAAGVAEALDRLHRLGFVHGDLKPENVIVGPAGPVLCDFGFARRADAAAPGEIDGTPFSIAPEVLLGAAPAPPADLFALGALLHRLLTGERASARRFYARFPARSFFDAAGSSPERLPPWARDLVAALVSRDPARRPSSADAVARALRARLAGTAADADAGQRAPDAPRLSLELGRERWLTDWLAELRDGSAQLAPVHLWVRVPEGEPPAAIAAALRLFAALRGLDTGRMALDEEVARCADPVALDRWAARAAAAPAGALVVAVDSTGPWAARGLEVLVRALRQGARPHAARLVCVAAGPPPASAAADFDELALPALPLERLGAFLARHLPREAPERRAAFAQLLHALAAGASARIGALLERAAQGGFLLPEEDDAWRLRPGALPAAADLALGLSADAAGALPEGEREVLAALHAAGGRLSGGELEALELHRDPRDILALAGRGLVALADQELVLRVRLEEPRALGARRLAARHARRAAALATAGAERWRILAHRFGAGEDLGAELVLELEGLLARGAAELVLSALERLEDVGRDAARDPLAEAPPLALLRARAWSALGRPERAAEALARLEAQPGAEGLALLGRAHLAVGRRATEEALALCARAAEADPALRGEVQLLRVQIKHELGRDEETLELVGAAGDAAPRQRAYLESLAAVSAFRLGRADEARARLEAVLAGALTARDAALEGAVRIDLAIVARRTGGVERAIAELEAAVAAYERVGHAAGLAHARATLGGVLREAGRMMEAEPLLAEAAALRERLGDERGATTVRGTFGLLLAERGHLRGAIEELERAAARMEGAQRLRFAPLLRARADEARARLGLPAAGDEPAEPEGPDPRALLARARAAWLRRERDAALAAARRALELARRLGLHPVADEAAGVAAALDPAAGPAPAPAEGTLAAEDLRLHALLGAAPEAFDRGAARALAAELEARGRDDRAARLWLALAARAEPGSGSGGEAHAAAERCLARTNAGLTAEEAGALRHHLLGIPDPWPGDLTPRPSENDEDWDMEIASLLEINRHLVEQADLASLLGEIVDAALKVTGAERGFLALAEDGRISFDTALDSRRGDIAQPDFEVSSSILREALERMQPLRLSNAVDDPLLGHTPSVVSLELRSILCVPFRVDAGLAGAIYVDHRLRTGAFGDKAERVCALLADQAALAIRQMRRLEEIRDLNRRLERRVATQEEDLAAAQRALRDAGVGPAAGRLIGRSRPMERVRALIDRAAATGLPVLVTGESGTGKELAARALHDGSPRATGPFVSESCAALPPTLIESELFGYRRGAFTGAEEDHAGLFERADGGTVLLDEIGEMPLELQAKLLRVLETGEVRRLGESKARRVDFRLVAATNRDLAREVQEGRFREDLYYRLDGLRVALPTLDERRDDIPLLVDHFLRAEDRQGAPPRRISRAVLERLASRAWPGNVRELRNEVARLCVLSEGTLEDPELVRAPDLPARRSSEPGGAPRTLADIERQAIEEALASTGGDKRKAAELLGISRAKIYARLKEWRIGEEG